MKIGINALCAENRSGTGRYASRLLPALGKFDSDNEYVVLLNADSPLREELADFPNFQCFPVNIPNVAARLWFEKFRLKRWILGEQIDVFHGPAFIIPPKCPVPAVVTIHDLVFHLFPETTPVSRRQHYRRAIPRSIREAAMILADSRSTARDLHEHLDVSPGKIEVSYLGVEEEFFEDPLPNEMEEVRRKYELPGRFLLSLGTMEPRKNLPGLLRAYSMLRHSDPDTPDLVVVGRRGWGVGKLRDLVAELSLEGMVHFPGFVEDADLPALYRLSDLFICLSLYEGFGLPVLEAMASGVPVVASDCSSIPEITGDKALLVNPEDTKQVVRTIAECLADAEESRTRAVEARERARHFNWLTTAEEALNAYKKALRQ
ncbi:MAG: glycosyltransferase family 4 protein [Candidatus Sumerlaeia bacterium]